MQKNGRFFRRPNTLANAAILIALVLPATVPQATTYPLTLPDALGGPVTLARRPTRIVSLAPNVTEMLFAIGAGDRVVGVTRYCNYPPEAARLPKVGGYTDLSIEAVLALAPDLVVVSRGNPRPTLAALSHRGLTLLAAINDETFDEVQQAIRRIGRATDNEREAEAVCRAMQQTLAEVDRAIGGIEPKRRVYFGSLSAPYFSAGPGSFIGQCIARAGGENVAADLGSPWPILSLERIVARDPEVILAGLHGGGGDAAECLQRLRASRVWSQLSAVRNGRVAVMDDDKIYRPGPRLADAVAELARVIYPERFSGDGPTTTR
ncbi:MAG: cobalamin-binding protein [Candidatus Sumerlaeia bacterium]|nr:cobalamin-binding protein [Candidatus Sumerlaeia bacterium]